VSCAISCPISWPVLQDIRSVPERGQRETCSARKQPRGPPTSLTWHSLSLVERGVKSGTRTGKRRRKTNSNLHDVESDGLKPMKEARPFHFSMFRSDHPPGPTGSDRQTGLAGHMFDPARRSIGGWGQSMALLSSRGEATAADAPC
jgi:hypothetical protein